VGTTKVCSRSMQTNGDQQGEQLFSLAKGIQRDDLIIPLLIFPLENPSSRSQGPFSHQEPH